MSGIVVLVAKKDMELPDSYIYCEKEQDLH